MNDIYPDSLDAKAKICVLSYLYKKSMTVPWDMFLPTLLSHFLAFDISKYVLLIYM